MSETEFQNEREIRMMIDARVQEILAESEQRRVESFARSLESQRNFLASNTRWVVSGFFGLLLIFAALITFLLGRQLDSEVMAFAMGSTVENLVSPEIQNQIGVQLALANEQIEESIDVERQAAINEIEQVAEERRQSAVDEIGLEVERRTSTIISAELEARIAEVQRGFIHSTNEQITQRLFPAGAILAFDRECPTEAGWIPFERSHSRMLVGATGPADRLGEWQRQLPNGDVSLERLPAYRLGETGGQPEHTLTADEMPAHSHSASDLRVEAGDHLFHRSSGNVQVSGIGVSGSIWADDNVRGKNRGRHDHRISGEVSSEGGGQPHDNMPPYVAVHFCIKTG